MESGFKRYGLIVALFLTTVLPAHAAGVGRIVSLKPSITDTIYALGLGDRLVGITRYCDVPDGKIRPEIVGDYTKPYAERIIGLNPDLVLGSMENSSRRSIETLERIGLKVKLFPFTTFSDTLDSIQGIANALEQPERGKKLVNKIKGELKDTKGHFAKKPHRRAVVVWGIRPLVVAGPGTYIDEVLSYIKVENAVSKTKVKYPKIGLEELIALNPDVIIDLSMGSEAKGTEEPKPWDKTEAIAAVKNGNIVRMDTGLLRAGPNLPKGIEILGEKIHR